MTEPTRPSEDDAAQFSLTPAKDEVASYKRKQQAPRSNSANQARTESRSSEYQLQAPPSQINRFLLFGMLVLGCLSAWLFYDLVQLRAEFGRAGQLNAQLNEQLGALATELTSAGESQNLSVQAMQVKLKNHDSEIRKLWGVSYDRNRGAIKGNQDSLQQQASQLKQMNKSLESLQSQARSTEQSNNQLKAGLSEANKRLAGVSQGQQQLVSRQQDLQSQQQRLNKDLVQLQKAQRASGIEQLQGRVEANEQAVEAIDTNRKQVNRKLIELNNQLNKLRIDLEILQEEVGLRGSSVIAPG